MAIGHILANGISGEGILILGCAFLVPALLIVIIEWLVLKFMCGRPQRALSASFMANLASALAGLALMALFLAGWNWLPRELDRYYSADRMFSLVRYVSYFLLSVGVEYAVVRSVILPQDGVKRLARGVLLGNLITYALICPLLYWATSPRQDLTDLRSDSAWSADGTTTILYLDPATGYLMKTDPRHAHTETVLAHHMTDYQIRPDLRSGLFLNGHTLFHFEDAKVTEVATLEFFRGPSHPPMSQVAMSPSGRSVAYTTPIKKKDSSGFESEAGRHLMIFDSLTAQSRRVTSSLENKYNPPALVWTTSENVILAIPFMDREIKQFTIARDQPAADEKTWAEEAPAEKMYGTFGTLSPSFGFDYTVASDQSPQLSAILSNLLVQHLLLWRGANHDGLAHLELGVRSGILAPTAPWRFADVAVIPGTTLCVMEEDAAPMLYLIDADARRLGRLVPGRKMVLLTPKYEAAKYLQKD
jgi:hypothetical protein